MQNRRFRGLSLTAKLTASCAAILALMTILSAASWRAITGLGGMLDSVARTSATETGLVEGITDGFQEMQDHAKKTQLAQAILDMERSSAAGPGRCSGCHMVTDAAQDRAEFEAAGARVERCLAELGQMLTGERPRQALDIINRDLKRWVEFYREYLDTAGANRFQEAHSIIVDRMLPLHDEIEAAAQQMRDAHRARLDGSAGEAARTTAANRWLTASLIALTVVVIAAIVAGLRRTSRDLLGITIDLGLRAKQVAGMAGEISLGSQAAAQGASGQAAGLHEVSSAAAGINATAQRNADRAGAASDLSAEFTRNLAEAGGRLEQLSAAMTEIQGASEKVAHIARMIDEIAFQTNILALNAAVEAARAGESGLGFAVVAGEVRTLAQRSAQAAKETAELIERAMGAAGNGCSRVSDVSAAFQRLMAGAGRVNELGGEVRSGSLEQARQVEQITERIHHISNLTDQAGSGALESARSGECLSEEAAGLTALVTRLAALMDGSATPGETDPAATASIEMSP